MKFFGQLEFGIQSGIRGVSKHKAASFGSFITISACLLLICCLLILGVNVGINLQQFYADNVILAFVDDTYTRDEAIAIASELRAVNGVKDVTFIPKEDAYEDFIEDYANSGKTSSYVVASIFRDRYAITMSDAENTSAIKTEVEAIPGIADVRADEIVARSFKAIQKTVTVVGVFIGVLLVVISIIIMTNTINLTTLARKEEIEVMKMMGAKDSFVRFPLVLEGCIISCFGGLLAFFVASGIYSAAIKIMEEMGLTSLITTITFSDLAMPVFAVSILSGFIVGFIGSRISVRKYLSV